MAAVYRNTQIIAKAFVIIVACYCAAHPGPCEPSPVSTAESLLVMQDYKAARHVLAEHLKKTPDDFEALYLTVAVAQTEMLDYESYTVGGATFIQTADTIRQALTARLTELKGIDSIKCLFYIANIYGGIGVIHGKAGNWFGAVKNAMTSITMLKEVVRRAPDMHAALLGTGVFQYYLCQSFKWLPLIDENSESEGVRDIERATKAPFPFDFAAKNSLCWILIDQKQFKRADSIAAAVLADIPGNTIFLRIRCLVAFWCGRHEQAISLGEDLARITLNRTPVNWSDLVAAYYIKTSAFDAGGRKKESIEAAEYILNAPIPRVYKQIPHVKRNLKRVQEIRDKGK